MKKFPLLVLISTIAIDMLGFGIIIPILPIYADHLGASNFTIGLIEASFAAAQFLFTPFWGGLSDRIGRRPVILISISMMILSYIILANAETVFLIFASRIVSGIGAANLSAAQAYISDITKPKDRAKTFGYIGAAYGIGFIFGPPLGGFLKTHFGIIGLGYGAAIFSVLNFVLAYFFLSESIHEKVKDTPIFRNPFSEIIKIFPRYNIRSILTVHFVFTMAFSMMQITASLLWAQKYQLTEQQIGYTFAFVGISIALIQALLIGPLSNRFGEKKLFVFGNFLMAIGLASLPFIPEDLFLPFEFIPLILVAFGNAFVTPTISSLLSQNAKKKEQGKILGLAQSVGALSRVIGPSLGGFLYGLALILPNVVAGAFLLITTFLAYLLVNKKMQMVAA